MLQCKELMDVIRNYLNKVVFELSQETVDDRIGQKRGRWQSNRLDSPLQSVFMTWSSIGRRKWML